MRPALLGFLAGVTFSGLLGVFAGRRRFDQMSIPRFAVWGGVGGLLVSVALGLATGLGGELLILGPILALSGAACAAGSLALARRAEDRELLGAPPRFRGYLADLSRHFHARSRPAGGENAARLRERGETPDSIVFRDAVAADIPALAELHVTTWNATYRTTRGPTVDTRIRQWHEAFAKEDRRDFILVLEDRGGRLIGFTWGKPHDGDFAGQLSKIYLRWEYHGLGLGRRMMQETAHRFLDREINSFILFAERSNPTIGFFDRMGGERLLDERGQFTGAYGWRDVLTLLERPGRSRSSPT